VIKNRAAKSLQCAPADLPAPAIVGAAGAGGLLYWLAIFPVDVVKSAVMADSIIPAERRYAGPAAAARALWAEGGVSRFYRGFTPCLLRAVPANGVMLLTVDKVQRGARGWGGDERGGAADRPSAPSPSRPRPRPHRLVGHHHAQPGGDPRVPAGPGGGQVGWGGSSERGRARERGRLGPAHPAS
jgi:hypothetical protein